MTSATASKVTVQSLVLRTYGQISTLVPDTAQYA